MCIHVLQALFKEYNRNEIDEALGFSCFFNSVKYPVKTNLFNNNDDSKTMARQRMRAFELLCGGERIYDIHRFCIPDRYLNGTWFNWVISKLEKFGKRSASSTSSNRHHCASNK